MPVVAQALALPEPTVQARVQALVDAGDAWPLPDGRLGCRPLLGGPDPATCALRRTLAAALPARHPGRLRLLAEAGASAHELVLVARAVLSDPDLSPGEAGAVIERALQVARLEGQATLEAELLCELAASALHMEAAGPLRQVLYEVGRGIAAGLPLEPVETLLRAVLHAVSGDLARGRALLEQVPPQAHEELELFRAACVAYSSRVGGLEEEERVLQELEVWAGDDGERRARLAGWWGNHLYRRGRFAEAAARHEAAAAGKRGPEGQLSSLRNAAAAWLEAQRFDRAQAAAEQVQARAAARRTPKCEAMATWTARTARARRDRHLPPRPELVAAARQVDGLIGMQLALAEAIQAWQVGDGALAVALAEEAARLYGQRGELAGQALAELVALLAGPPAALRARGPDLARRARSLRAPGVRLQVLGLLGQALGDEGLRAEARAALDAWGGVEPSTALELVSVAQAVGLPR